MATRDDSPTPASTTDLRVVRGVPPSPPRTGETRSAEHGRTRIVEVVHEMRAELDRFLELGARAGGGPGAEATESVTRGKGRLAAEHGHLIQLVCLLTELTDLVDEDPHPHLSIVDADGC
jgi:hypothetical protein